MTFLQTAASLVNRVMLPLVRSGVGSGALAVLTYTGRRSGQVYSLPVAYRRDGDHVWIGIGAPGQKTWWRNFLGDGGPVSLRVGGEDRSGHARAVRDGGSDVHVEVELDPA
ncbi:nitroreductase/quinone reductase family protein [Actinomycetospora sp. OC33-EN08]|uniref:Nitroreductase/quinone reductase family protein n=1 Tax=Actinomycetospora aurantiaca TaxID=3129233 RepID=A0ABU8MTC4_9PSEU